jgi:peptidyl-lysine (3S)-dioxygenase / protease
VKLELELEEPEKMVPWCSVDPYPASDEILAEQISSFPLYFNGPKPFQCTVRAGEILYL